MIPKIPNPNEPKQEWQKQEREKNILGAGGRENGSD